MRENTRCEVEEPISTPTLSTTISSSSTSERPVLVKKMRPPSPSSAVMATVHPSRMCPVAPCATGLASCAREFGHGGALLVKAGLHSARHAFRLERRLVLGADERIFHPVGDGGAALGNIHPGIIDVLLAGRAGLAARIVRSEPRRQTQRLFRRAKVLVIPPRPAGGRRHHSHRFVVDALDLVAMALLPRRDAVALRPDSGVALGIEADQRGGRRVRVRLGIAAVLVLPDPQIKRVAGHERLDATPAR